MRQLGYIGSYTGLARLLSEWRQEKPSLESNDTVALQVTPQIRPVVAMRHVSPQEAAALLSKPKPMLDARQSKIVEFLKRTADFATMRSLVLSFRSILRRGKVSGLKRWIERARSARIPSMSRFVRQLKKDWPAVEHAVEYLWSNGPTEGHINRLRL
jgi:transposase